MPQQTIAPPAPPALPAPFVVRQGSVASSPVAVYEATLAQREALGNQLNELQHQRNSITGELTNTETRGLDRTGLEARLGAVDARIATLDKQIAAADERVATAAAIPTAVATHNASQQARDRWEREHSGPPEEPFILGGIFIVVVLFPISVAYARRIWRRGAAAVTALPADLAERLSSLDQAIESIAIEVERIGEGQRFVTRVMTDNAGRAVGAGAAEPVRQPARDPVPVRSAESQR